MSEGRISINVSAVDYEATSRGLNSALQSMEKMIHGKDEYIITGSEFAFGWHFFVVSVRYEAVESLAKQLGSEFDRLRGRGIEKKFLSWLERAAGNGGPRFKVAIKEEMESSKFGIF